MKHAEPDRNPARFPRRDEQPVPPVPPNVIERMFRVKLGVKPTENIRLPCPALGARGAGAYDAELAAGFQGNTVAA